MTALLLVLAAVAGCVRAREDTIPMEWGYGTRLLQIRASMVSRRVVTLTAKPSENQAILVPTEPPVVAAIRVVGEAAAASQGDGHVSLDNASSDKREGPNASRMINHTIEDVIEEEEAEAISNKTVAQEGRKALSRKHQGQKTKEEQNFDDVVKQSNATNKTMDEQLNNKTIQKAIKARVEEKVDMEVAKKVQNSHRLPSPAELNKTVTRELQNIWYDLIWAARHKTPNRADISFWKTVAFYDWCLLGVALMAFVMLYHFLLDWPSTKLFHGAALLIWVVMAVLYWVLIWSRQGQEPAMVWLIGYVLEFIFSIENLFVFHIIVKAFERPRYVTQKVMFVVVLCQITFQWVFYMGLATWLRSLQFLPYMLGIWLMYVGWQAMMEDEHAKFDIMKTRPVSWVKWLLGQRLSLEMDPDGSLFVTKGGKTCVTPDGLLLFCLLLADFLLEVDVTVTKIEGFPSRYICFSSSMVASFALPELFFVARDLFHRFFGLKYGISFVLIFCGVQALLHKLFTLPALVSLSTIVGVILVSIAFSAILGLGKGNIGTENVGRPAEGPILGSFTAEKADRSD